MVSKAFVIENPSFRASRMLWRETSIESKGSLAAGFIYSKNTMDGLQEKTSGLISKYGYSVFGGGFVMLFISAPAHALGYTAAGFWFLVLANWVTLTVYFMEKRKSERRQQEINRYRKNGVNI